MPKIPRQDPNRLGGGQRSNRATFRNAGGRVPPPPKRPTFDSSGKKSGCPLTIIVGVIAAGATLAYAVAVYDAIRAIVS